MAEKKRMVGGDREPICFTTDTGTMVRLVWEKVEYRAYRQKGGRWEELRLGATLPDRLIEYIRRRH